MILFFKLLLYIVHQIIYFHYLINNISKFLNIIYHIYSDDIQLIIKIPVNLLNSNLEHLECASEIINWLLRIDLIETPRKPNYSIYLRYILIFHQYSLMVGLYILPSVRNLVVIFDSSPCIVSVRN